MRNTDFDVLMIGSGVAGLSAGCLLARRGLKVGLVELNYLPGGCVSTYYRKGYRFEAGATTLVGLDPGMPLRFLLDTCQIEIPHWTLSLPMVVRLKNGALLHRTSNLTSWIAQCEQVFGIQGQASFWTKCYAIAQKVWRVSTQQRSFPPSRWIDWWMMALRTRPEQITLLPYAFQSIGDLMRHQGLHENEDFMQFVDEQLLITAQNHHNEVNALFGATALCYTLFTNAYIPGGLLNLVQPLVDFIHAKGGQWINRNAAQHIEWIPEGYRVQTEKGTYTARFLVSAIPLNNTLELWKAGELPHSLQQKVFKSEQLVSAFQMGIGFESDRAFDSIHYQFILPNPLPVIGSKSIFMSLNHPDDKSRSPDGHRVANISTHIFDPEKTRIEDKKLIEDAILQFLNQEGWIINNEVRYVHSSTPKSWEEWTGRKYGFVGGYPQYMHIKPWQMKDARLDHRGAYICGDSTYPGQGIPGACLSGILAAEKLLNDHDI